MQNFTTGVRAICFSFSMVLCFSAIAQGSFGTYNKVPNVNITPNLNGYVEYLPTGYDPSGTQRYPLLIFFMGINSHGDGTIAGLESLFSLNGGFPTDQFKDSSWIESYTVNGQTHKFIVLAPQFISPYDSSDPSPEDVNSFINYAIANYKVDINRIYLTGNSSGGGPTINYIGADSTGTLGYGKRIAAVVAFSPAYVSTLPTQAKANVYRTNEIPIWLFHNDYDNTVPIMYTQQVFDFLNTPTPSPAPSKFTIFSSPDGWGGHNSWYGPYMRTYQENGLNIYEWMLQFSRTSDVILPVNFTMFNAACENGRSKLTWKTTGETNVQRFAIEKSDNGNNWSEIGTVPPSAPSSGEKAYHFTDPSAGNGFYRIVEHSFDGRRTISSVIRNGCKTNTGLSIFPNPATDKIMISISVDQRSRLNYFITDAKGAVIQRKEIALEAGLSQVPVLLHGIPQGIYTIHASWGSSKESMRFLKN
jgi:hypothetical protein